MGKNTTLVLLVSSVFCSVSLTHSIVGVINMSFLANAQQSEPKANIVNGKYLTIKDPEFREESSSYSITGTIVNDSTQEISQVSAYAILYDKYNKVITVNSAIADVSTLKPGDYSAFKVPFFN